MSFHSNLDILRYGVLRVRANVNSLPARIVQIGSCHVPLFFVYFHVSHIAYAVVSLDRYVIMYSIRFTVIFIFIYLYASVLYPFVPSSDINATYFPVSDFTLTVAFSVNPYKLR